MRVYPNGCHVAVVVDGVVLPQVKLLGRRHLDSSLVYQAWKSPWTRPNSAIFLIVRPRGKLKWWLFSQQSFFDEWKFEACDRSFDRLAMMAVLGDA